ncbi:MAG: ATP-binding protein [Pirellulales bacterium]|nr:ATP-binding protein [Pirellulales bacterium]
MTELLKSHSEPACKTTNGTTSGDLAQFPKNAGLEVVLNAWNDVTVPLQETHEVLPAKVRRLTVDLKKKNRQITHKNRPADLGRMAFYAAHKVSPNPVPVTPHLSSLKRRLSEDPNTREKLAKVEPGFTPLDTTVNDLLAFTSHREPQWNSILVRELIDEVCEAIGPQLDAQSIRLVTDVAPQTQVNADREMLRRAVLNLILNAIDVMQTGGELVITSVDSPSGLDLEIADSGPGLDREQLLCVFDPSYTTKPSGAGLGLAIVQRIAAAHGGRVLAANCPEGGTAFTIQLPRRRPSEIAA